MAEEKKTEEKKAAPKATSVELTDDQKWGLEHAELVEARKAAERAVFEHRQAPTQDRLKAVAKAALKAAGKDGGNGDDKKATKEAPKKEEAPKAAAEEPKKQQFVNPYQSK